MEETLGKNRFKKIWKKKSQGIPENIHRRISVDIVSKMSTATADKYTGGIS